MTSTTNTTNKPLRRVGTLTLGVCLIAAGVLFLLARFLPGLPWMVIWQVLPAAGLILLGCEVLYYSARPGACRCGSRRSSVGSAPAIPSIRCGRSGGSGPGGGLYG